MLNIGPQELLLILVVALIVVGPTRLPELGRSIGKGLREIRKAQDEVKRTIQVNLDEPGTGKAPKPRAGPRDPSPEAEPDTEAGAAAPGPAAADTAAEAVPPAISPDPVPLAADPPPTSEVREISRTLGRSLAELRRARDEIQRSFRVDPGQAPVRPSPARTATDPASTATPADAEPATAPADEAPAG